MKIYSCAILAMMMLLGEGESKRLGEKDNRELAGLQEIMGSPPAERLYPGEGNAKATPNGKCRLRLNTGGNLMVEKKVGGTFKTAWQTGNAKGGGNNFFAAFQTDGNLVVYRENGPGEGDNEAVYATGTNLGSPDIYHLYLEDNICALQISEGVSNVWKSLDYFALSQNANPYANKLKKGNFYSPPDYYSSPNGLSMYLQNDCNLLIFEGSDLSDMGAVRWASNTVNPNLNDCYLSAEYNQAGGNKLTLYGDGNMLWRSDVWPAHYVICLSVNGPFPCEFEPTRI